MHTEAAIYWAAVSLIVCEGLSIRRAASQLGISGKTLRDILHRRGKARPFKPRLPSLYQADLRQ